MAFAAAEGPSLLLPLGSSPGAAAASPASSGLNVMASSVSSSQPSRVGSNASSRSSVAAVPSACLACRNKHLKCDGRRPCSRCITFDSECVYIASRRGYKGPSRKKLPSRSLALLPARPAATVTPVIYGPPRPAVSNSSHAPIPVSSSSAIVPSSYTTASGMYPVTSASYPVTSAVSYPVTSPYSIPSELIPSSELLPSSSAVFSSCAIPAFNPTVADFPDFGLDFPIAPQTSAPHGHFTFAFDGNYDFDPFGFGFAIPTQNPTFKDRYVESFYRNFHPAHPFVLPKDYLLPLVNGEPTIDALVATVRWIGSSFVEPAAVRAKLLDEAYQLVYKPNTPKDGFTVQAMLLLIIGLDGDRKREKVHILLTDIQNLAVHIGLNKRWYASANGRNMPVLEESWRRTWWDLYIVDALIAGVHRSTNFNMFTIPADVALPCEESEFLSGYIPQPLNLEDMDNITFLGGDMGGFSSFAYRIQCACYLGKLIQNPPIFGLKDKNVAKIETLLVNWRLNLPAAKSRMLYKDGKLDEMMFQAFMMTNAISILLHQPHSQLDPSLTQNIDACAPNTPAISSAAFNAHTKHTIRSANELTKLIGHRVPLLSHTHFFAYMITLASTIHLSEWSLSFVSHNDDNLRQRIRLSTGALSQFARIWPAAEHLGLQVKTIARDIYRVKTSRLVSVQDMSIPQEHGEGGSTGWNTGVAAHST
ncbi:N-terminal binuclear Zn cluster-containing/DNA binding domain-containing protein [Dactylonectria estremocensis]|uniref:N-terminal binuclear Zn cluster-containing/DNA binding domain-containing protein n=1 Tax=Dactylonectria estremocensis TaxID=1079267 RepID=A0A9P9II36_9HYPO|nr:N-terminal binuclear Zn cluster-containing/DNA binding domain-containing protein [Dactylonectria estremocensis]